MEFCWHKWSEIDWASITEMRCRIRREITGEGGIVTSTDLVYDRICLKCGKRDDRITPMRERIQQEEQRRWELIQQSELAT